MASLKPGWEGIDNSLSRIRESVKREHCLEAISFLKKNGWESKYNSIRYDLPYEGKKYPPKHVLCKAYRIAKGNKEKAGRFPGGRKTNELLRKLGFQIVAKNERVADPKETKAKSADVTTKNEIVADLEEIRAKPVNETKKKALIDARLGQGAFRTKVLKRWDSRCCVTGSATLDAIRASHIKPWRDSNDDPEERLDRYNGLPLIATLDALFDVGLITFAPDGKLLVSKQLNANEKKLLGLDGRQKLRKNPGKHTAKYLEYHRNTIFQGQPGRSG